ncbi:MAG TPA: AAA family ATPase [Dissulfurispiraceae bacterium]|nr:AAA family ATPase [Dissulfurispiraceae bacterium]
MQIAFVEIQNFRKLKACRVGIAEQETIFVGANNSGKTSAMDALILFLKKSRHKDFATTDFTLSNWLSVDQFGAQWAAAKEEGEPDLTLNSWMSFLPAIDIWLKADEKDIHRIAHLLPTLDWTPKDLLGVRLVLAPKNMEQLYKGFLVAYKSARNAESSSSKGKSALSLWPHSMRDFLDRELHKHFAVQAYILDPAQCHPPENGIAKPQPLPADSDHLNLYPFDGLFKIDVITAQRGFSDPKTEADSHSGFASLSTQLRQYFSKHLDPTDAPDPSDVEALEAIEAAKTIFDEKLKTSFKSAIGELEGLNYPGFSDPKISLTSKLSPVDSLDHKTAVQFDLPGAESLSLPEKYNGLGYQNLISMVFSLIRFRDEWMRVGKAAKNQGADSAAIEPLHIVLIEEPEAHLHAQIQQVFTKKAYTLLRAHATLKDDSLSTQLIVSTHSSHIAHEVNFTCLRYFRREAATKKGEIPTARVVNLSKTFGNHDDTSKFATRYLRTTHCDLFFADAAILVEGSAERMLVPHFIRTKFPKLDQRYISILEIGGAHAHRLRPLLETLGLLSLIITDLDSVEASSAKALPERGGGYSTGNITLKDWVPKKESLDDLLDLPADAKQTANKLVRVAYQCPITVKYKESEAETEAIPYTFEDALALTNLEMFRGYSDPIGLLRKLKAALGKATLAAARKDMFENLKKGSKAEMALELLYLSEPDKVLPPVYIAEGLEWLEEALDARAVDVLTTVSAEVKNA